MNHKPLSFNIFIGYNRKFRIAYKMWENVIFIFYKIRK